MGSEALTIATGIAKPFEGLRLKAYRCPAGVWTIGYGHTGGVTAEMEITLAQAEQLLEKDMYAALVNTIRLCPPLVNYPRKLGAIVDFVFNCGSGAFKASTLRKRLLEEDFVGAVPELQRWVRAGGVKLRGLVLRRDVEAILVQE